MRGRDPIGTGSTPRPRRPRKDMGDGSGSFTCRGGFASRPLSYPGSAGFRDRRDLEISQRGGCVRTLVSADGCGLWRIQRIRKQHRPCDQGVSLMTPLLEARAITRRFGHVRASRWRRLLRPRRGDLRPHRRQRRGQVDAREDPFWGGPAGRGTDPCRRQGRRLQFPQRRAGSRHCDGLSGSRSCRRSAAFRDSLLGREIVLPGLRGQLGFVNRAAIRRRPAEQFERLGVRLRSPRAPVSSLSGGQRQSVAIARAAMWATASSSWTSPPRLWASCRLDACLT